MAYNISDKLETIQKYKGLIEKLKQKIIQIEMDPSLTDDERRKKVAHRMSIIDGYTSSIQQAEEYIKRETLRTHQIYEHQMNKMK